jgi:hypothetical protein
MTTFRNSPLFTVHYEMFKGAAKRIIVLALVALAQTAEAAENVDPGNDDSQYAWAANMGWLNAEPLGDGGPGMELLSSSTRGWLWAANTGWISLSCENTASCGDVDYGVGHDGSGQLSGYAWSPNTGWISFSCSDSDSCANVDYGVEFDSGSGKLIGYAYSANAGWISFSCMNTASCNSVDYGIRLDFTLQPPLLFKDGFESL